MRKTKEQKAITLIALIITIVVLLILAVVAINAVTGDGIIQHATNARDSYENAQAKEEGMLSYYQEYLDAKGDFGPWKQEGNIIYMTDSNDQRIELKIGDKIAYNELSNGEKTHFISYKQNGGDSESKNQTLATESLGWRVLGLDKYGHLELISNKPTKDYTIYLMGENGYLNAETILNTTCNELYGKGIGALSARSLNINDVNKLAGIITEEDKRKIVESKEDDTNHGKYGDYWRFKYDENLKKIFYSKDYNIETKVGTWENTTYEKFKEPGKLEINESNKQSEAWIKCTGFSYVISEKIKLETSDGKLISNLLTNGLDYGDGREDNINVNQWLATNEVVLLNNNNKVSARFGVHAIGSGQITNQGLWNSYGTPRTSDFSIPFRPVVTLKSNVQIEGAEGIYTIK